jgi:hypothetical protein
LNAFISYSTTDKHVAGKVKDALEKFAVSSFMAHETIEVSQQWQDEIIKHLRTADIFIPLLSANFNASIWALQEVGFIVSRPDVPIIPLSLDGTLPRGFIGQFQAKRLLIEGDYLPQVIPPVVNRRPEQMIPKVINVLKDVRGFRYAEAVMALLVPDHLDKFMDSDVKAFADACINNSQIWNAGDCQRTYIPKFLEIHGTKLSGRKSTILRYQIKTGNWHPQIKARLSR